MNTLSLGDVHGITNWSIPTFGGMDRFYNWQTGKFVDSDFPFTGYDKIIFVGDYTDSFDLSNLEILHNLKNIIEFKKAYPDKVILLIGNHDIQYITGNDRTRCSGYRPEAYHDLHQLFTENINLFQIAYQYDNWLWTHSGLTSAFLNHCVLSMKDVGYRFHSVTKDMSISELLNFMFTSNNKDLYNVGASSRGSSLFPSVIWARPEDLDSDTISMNQIVGHTNTHDIEYSLLKNNNESVEHIYIDCLNRNKWLIKSF